MRFLVCFWMGYFGCVSSVLATRYDAPAIIGMIKPLLGAHLSSSADFDIVLDNLAVFLQGEGELNVTDLRLSPDQKRLGALLTLTDDGVIRSQLRVQGRVQMMATIPVLTVPKSPDEVIKAEDVTWLRLPQQQVSAATIQSDRELVGKSPHLQPLPSNRAILRNQIRLPILVKKGSIVYISYKTPSVFLSTQGEAKADGTLGETISFKPVNSQRMIQAKVTGPQQAEIKAPEGFSEKFSEITSGDEA